MEYGRDNAIPKTFYEEMVSWLTLLDEKELLEMFHDMNDVSAVERIADCAYHFVENHGDTK